MISKILKFIFDGCYHEWTKWRIQEEFNIKNFSTGGIIAKGIEQRKECSKCGLVIAKVDRINNI